MANRISYDVLAPEAHKLIIKLVSAKSDSERKIYHQAYIDLLEAAGWSDQAFDNETLKRVDEAWDNKNNKLLN